MFGTFIKGLRAHRQLGLRECCLEHGHDPGNWSKIEREVLLRPGGSRIHLRHDWQAGGGPVDYDVRLGRASEMVDTQGQPAVPI